MEKYPCKTSNSERKSFVRCKTNLIAFCQYKGTGSIHPSARRGLEILLWKWGAGSQREMTSPFIYTSVNLQHYRIKTNFKIDKPFGWASLRFRHKYALPFGRRIFLFIRRAFYSQVNNVNFLLVYLTGHSHRTGFANNTGTYARK